MRKKQLQIAKANRAEYMGLPKRGFLDYGQGDRTAGRKR